jgi:hypothetical protein
MFTCKDCVHYECCHWLADVLRKHGFGVEFDDNISVDKTCEHFKNKADFVEVKHGEWEEERWCDNFQHTCSLCHKTARVHPQSVAYKYCPYCGAKMIF